MLGDIDAMDVPVRIPLATPPPPPPPTSDEPLPIVVACRLKPNPSNEPTALWCHHATLENATLTFLNPDPAQSASGGGNPSTVSENFHYVLNESTSQETVFQTCIAQFLPLVQVGYDLTLMTYGPAGAGKTHTLVGSDLPLAMNESDFGLVPRVIRQLFHDLNQADHGPNLERVWARVSFMDVDNDQIRDLLSNDGLNRVDFEVNPDPQHKDFGRNTVLRGLTVIDCHGTEDVLRCLEIGLTVHRIRLNSSHDILSDLARGSHNIFSAQFIQQYREGEVIKRVTSTLRFVDLAPSDQLFSPHSRLPPGPKTINHGLLALTNVVSALGDARLNTSTPFYNDSLLTKILTDALGGSSLMVLFCCVSPLERDLTETVSALEFARKASNIRNQPRPNVSFLSSNQGRRDSEMSGMRSASINHGVLPPISTYSNSKPSSLIGFPAEPPLLAPAQSVINSPPSAMLNDPVLLAIHIQQLQLQQHYNQILASRTNSNTWINPQLVSQPPLIPPGPPGSTFHPIPLPGNATSLSNSSLASPFALHSPLPVSYYMSAPPPDPASVPVSIDTEELERMNRELPNIEDGDLNEEDPKIANVVRQKLESIVEESESPLANSSVKIRSSPSDSDSPSELSEPEEDSEEEDFDSEASVNSCNERPNLEDIWSQVRDETDKVTTKYQLDLLTVLRLADGGGKVSNEKSQQVKHLEETNLRLTQQLQIESLHKQSLESELCQMMKNMEVVSAQFQELEKKSLENPSPLHSSSKSISSTCALANGPAVIPPDPWRQSISLNADLLRTAKDKLIEERAILEEEFQNVKRRLVDTQDDKLLYEATLTDLEASEAKRAQLDELLLGCDWAIDFKNDLRNGQAIDYSTANSDFSDELLMKVICELVPEERNALIHKFLNRCVDLRVEQAVLERHCDTLTFNIEEYKRESNNLFHRLVLKSQKYKEALKTQERENAKKTKVLTNIIEELREEVRNLEERKKDLKQNNHLLMNFYRHHRHCGNNSSGALAKEATKTTPTSNKPSVEIRDQKLVISKPDNPPR
ncbi:hypothetical protein TCAL_04922 [Tigriopus californicus]|uniref:Kinesin motor domain-containing protein n=1 Tax=Tigriopus californicus TaxID=6832 RepID=A0A553NBZ5_TIGCA|nr:kinesin-related protein 8-like [Tigriopus californicus]TRY62963.1 hypothetical protein TCAL_04922 [Tigriopus californicus]